MSVVKNYLKLASSDKRKIALKILEAGLLAIQPEQFLKEYLSREGEILRINQQKLRLSKYERVFLIGFGKGSSEIALRLEEQLGTFLTKGWVIDTVIRKSKKIDYTLGTHPLPSRENLAFTNKVLDETRDLTDKDLILIVICGGGSALFEAPFSLTLQELSRVFSILINSGAGISEINIVRKHLSKVKGGGLAKHLYPAKVVNLLFSDVPGNDLSVIASGPTVRDRSTTKKAINILDKYGIDRTSVPMEALTELPKEAKYFDNVTSTLILSNMTALEAMQKEAKNLGFKSFILSDRLQGDAKKVGRKLIELTPPGKILLAGGETTIKVIGMGKGGRNQTLVLASLPVPDDTLILSFDSDGVDFYEYGGALGDSQTWQMAQKLKLEAQEFLKEDNSFAFFEKTGDGILTGKLGSNVTDLIMVLKI